ncbi:MAG: hypothetical protein NPIRA05_03200 [Nitrospirales bacterium]|nr:MAG: hypothetical protein NPIRA05_03200 [Nitrospirales bacterium]
MNGTFMFGEDRFDECQDFSAYYDRLNGTLSSAEINRIIREVYAWQCQSSTNPRSTDTVLTFGRHLYELVQGMRNQDELVAMRAAFRQWEAKVVYLTEEMSSKAMRYVERYALSHSLYLADALIGATAVVCSLPLLTANTKHYRVITDLDLRVFRP